jgi:hypothetical protein
MKQDQTIELNVKERIFLIRAIGVSSTGFADRVILRAVRDEIDFNEKEIKELKMKDVQFGEQVQTRWDQRKANKLKPKLLELSEDRDRILRRVIIDLFKQSGMIMDGFDRHLFFNLSWDKQQFEILSSVVDQMDKNEKITEANFPICKEIKDAVNSHGDENTGESAEHKENV